MNHHKNITPLISVIMATYNRAALISRALDSLINQDFANWELIVVDDGSEDNTFETVLPYTEKYEQIRYLRHKNRRQNLSVNTGISLACGEYVTFLDSDDAYKSNHLSAHLTYLEAHPDIDVLYGGLEIIGDQYVKDKNDLAKLIHIDDCASLATFFCKKSYMLELEGFKDLAYSSDSDFLERAQQRYKVEKFPFKTYVYYRDTEDGICNNV